MKSHQQFNEAFVEGIAREFQFPCYQEEVADQPDSSKEQTIAEVQDSQGNLNQTMAVVPINYGTTGRSMEVLPISGIRRVPQIPDYTIRTSSSRPIIGRTPEGLYCLEGWNLIEEARRSGFDSLECEIDTMDRHSDSELMIRKVGMRTATRGGEYVYAEVIRNTRELYNHLKSSQADLRDYGHGGRRRGEGFVNNRDDDTRHVISVRLCMNRDTVNNHLNYAEYLSQDVLNFFIQQRATKKFFEAAQKEKRKRMKNLVSRRVSEEELTREISHFMQEIFESTGGEGRRRNNVQTNNPGDDGHAEEGGSTSIPQEPDIENEEVIDSIEAHDIDEELHEDDPDVFLNNNGRSTDVDRIISEVKDTISDIAIRINLEIQNASGLDQIVDLLTRQIDSLTELRDHVRSLMA